MLLADTNLETKARMVEVAMNGLLTSILGFSNGALGTALIIGLFYLIGYIMEEHNG